MVFWVDGLAVYEYEVNCVGGICESLLLLLLYELFSCLICEQSHNTASKRLVLECIESNALQAQLFRIVRSHTCAQEITKFRCPRDYTCTAHTRETSRGPSL